jgi:hypothetical protein
MSASLDSDNCSPFIMRLTHKHMIIKQTSMLHKNNEMKKLKCEMVRNEVNINKSVKWSGFKAAEIQINVNLILNTTKSNNTEDQ